jgi:hypothetical protein
MPHHTVPTAFVQAPFVIVFDAARFEATYGFPRDDESDDPRFNLTMPFGLKAAR